MRKFIFFIGFCLLSRGVLAFGIGDLPPGHRICKTSLANLSRIISLTRAQLGELTLKDFDKLRLVVNLEVRDIAKRAELTANQRSLLGMRTEGFDLVPLKGQLTTRKPAGRNGNFTQTTVQKKGVYWGWFVKWREDLVRILNEQETEYLNSLRLESSIEDSLNRLLSPEGREEVGVWLLNRKENIPDFLWSRLLSETVDRGLPVRAPSLELRKSIQSVANQIASVKDVVSGDQRLAFLEFMKGLELQELPLCKQILETHPELLPNFSLKIKAIENSPEGIKRMELGKRVMTQVAQVLVRELILFVANAPDTLEFPVRRRKDGNLMLVNRGAQVLVSLDAEGTVSGLELRFSQAEELILLLPKKDMAQEPVTRLPHPTQPAAPTFDEPSRVVRIAQHSTEWRLNSKRILNGTLQGLQDLGIEFPGAQSFVSEELLPLMEEYSDLFRDQGFGNRFLKKIKGVVDNHDRLTSAEQMELARAILESHKQSNSSTSRDLKSVDSQASVTTGEGNLNSFLEGKRPLEDLEVGVPYTLFFDRQPESGLQTVVFHKSVLEFLTSERRGVKGLRWLRILKRGRVPDTGFSGVKHRNWTRENPYDWEIKRMGEPKRILMNKGDGGVWQIERVIDEH